MICEKDNIKAEAFAVKDVLSCPVMQIHTARTAATYFEGKKVFPK